MKRPEGAAARSGRESDSPSGRIDSKPTLPDSVSQRPSDDPFASRRRFVVLATMAGWVSHERLLQRVLEEVAREAEL